MKPSVNWLLVLVPVALAVRYLAPGSGIVIFFLSVAAMAPLAKLLSDATEQVAARTGPTVGALLNVTFGNAGELVIGFFALQQGLHRLVKASLTGSILVNLLLTLGLSMLAGGLRKRTLRFNPLAARTQTTMLFLAAIALILPAAFALLGGRAAEGRLSDLSTEFSVILLVLYGLSLLFALRTHHQLLGPQLLGPTLLGPGKAEPEPPEAIAPEAIAPETTAWSGRSALGILAVSALLVGWIGEVLVGSVEHAATALGMTELFVGLVVVAAAGNAAESTAAIRAALKNRMDLSVGIAVGSSIQVALFVAPALVILSRYVGPRQLDLVFTPIEIVALVLAVIMVGEIASDGDSNWLEGAQLVAVYLMLAVLFFAMPEPGAANRPPGR